ncbi:unnamed protein product [Effrenium voratum]|nr:unnamed protein product [Effrenium voratum]
MGATADPHDGTIVLTAMMEVAEVDNGLGHALRHYAARASAVPREVTDAWQLELRVIIIYITVLLVFFRGLAPGQCGSNPCPVAWASGDQGGYFCEDTRGCRPAVQGPFPTCRVGSETRR